MDAVDKIRDTATSHERLFFVEVMGRDAGFLALNGAIASGAEAAIIPEFSTEVDQLEEFIKNGFRKSKNSSIVLVAESELTGGAMHYAERVKNEYPQYDVRTTVNGIVDSIAEHVKEAEASDDLTILLIQYEPGTTNN